MAYTARQLKARGGAEQLHAYPFENQLIFPLRGDHTSDDGDTVRRWALRGQGIAYKSYLDIAQHLASGELVRLLPQVTGEPSPLMLLVINRRRLNSALRQLAGEMAGFCQGLQPPNSTRVFGFGKTGVWSGGSQ